MIGNGSAVIIDASNGLIVTNAHVVEGGQVFQIALPDGRTAPAQLLGTDAATDLAVLKIALVGHTQIPFGDSDGLRVGDVVFAIGYPLGMDQTVTIGIVSGLGRWSEGTGIEDFIQTDAAINQGNSGGSLLDSKGRLIGINTSIITLNEGSVGLGFAVPSKIVEIVSDQIVRNGEVRRGVAGLVTANIDPADLPITGLDRARGALVVFVDRQTPAFEAGLSAGDVILTLNGQTIDGGVAYRALTGLMEPGETMQLDILRNGQKMNYSLTLADPIPAEISLSVQEDKLSVFGAKLQAHDPKLGIPQGFEGPMVTDLAPGAEAERSGLKVFDIVVEANWLRIETPRQLAEVLAKSSPPWQIGVIRPYVNAVIPIMVGN